MKTNRQLEILVIKTSFDMSAKDYPSGAPGTKSVPNLPVRAFTVSVWGKNADLRPTLGSRMSRVKCLRILYSKLHRLAV